MTDTTEAFEMNEPEIQQRAAQPYLAIWCHVTDGVPAAVDSAFPELFAWLGEHGVEPGGPPFIRTREVDRAGEPLELEAAVPVVVEVQGDGRVRVDTIPAGRYVSFLHVGPYRSTTATDLGAARAALLSWMADHGIVHSHETDRGSALPCCVEHFRIGPVTEPDFYKWETEFAYLIVD